MSKQQSVLLVLVGLLFAIWPVPHTNSIRDALLVVSIVLAGWLSHRRRATPVVQWRSLRWPAILLVALTAWIVTVALFVSPETAWSLDEARGQWLKPVFALVLGALAVAVLAGGANAPERLWLGLGVLLMLHILAINLEALSHLFRDSVGFRATGLTGGADKANYLSNIAVAMLLAELLARLRAGRRLLPVPGWGLALAALLTLSSMFAEGIRGGMVAAGVMFLCAVGIYFAGAPSRHRLGPVARLAIPVCMLATIAGTVVLAGSIKPGSSWQKIAAAVPIGLDTETHRMWLNSRENSLPTLPDGGTIDESTYLRVAWLKEGIVASIEHPFGVGFGRNAFGHAVQTKYGAMIGHSHSSFVDLLVGIGIVGVLLWLVLLASLLRLAVRGFAQGWGYALFLLVVDFATRMLIDSNVRDHMFQMFMFLVGVTVFFTAASLSTPSGPEKLRR